jgi:hypothetical protein
MSIYIRCVNMNCWAHTRLDILRPGSFFPKKKDSRTQGGQVRQVLQPPRFPIIAYSTNNCPGKAENGAVRCHKVANSHSISHSLLQALEACLCPMVMLVGEAVRRLRDNEAGLVQLERLRGEKGSEMSEAEVRELAGALAVNTTLTMLDLRHNALGKKGGRAMGEALAVNTTLTQLDLGENALGEEGGRAMGEALAVNTTLTQLNLVGNGLG